MKEKIILCWIVFMAISACTHVSGYFRKQRPYKKLLVIHSKNFNGIIEAKNIAGQNYVLHTIDKKTGKKNSLVIHHAIYTLQSGDINNDGKTDICIGISTPKDSKEGTSKTFFVFEIEHGHIRPLLTQTFLHKPLESFKVFYHNQKSTIRTIEKDTETTYAVGEYEWVDTKLSLLSYKGVQLSLEKARFVMHQVH